MPVEVRSVKFGYRKVCRGTVDVQKVSFDFHNACGGV